MVKDPWDVKQDKCPAPQIVGWWANFFSSIWAFQLSFRLALINSSRVGLPDSFGLETGFWEIDHERSNAALFSFTEINEARVVTQPENSDPDLHHFLVWVSWRAP
jgi:hypothetical protein